MIKLLQYILGLFKKKYRAWEYIEKWDIVFIGDNWKLFKALDEAKKERNKKLQFLHKCMMQYENKTGENLTKIRQDILSRNNINSRSELTDEQLDQEIKFFTSI